MSILPASGIGDESTGFYPHEIDQSLRFDGSTSKFEKTPSSDGNRKKWTSSWWVKRTNLGELQYMWSSASYYGNDGIAALYFNTDDKIHMYFDGNTHPYGPINSRVYRDISQWYHIVWAVDAENTVAKVWVNGVEETNGIQPPNFSYGMNKASTKMGFGFATWGGSPNYKGYLAEFVHLDGQYLDETYFGEFINGTWVPKNIYDQNFTFGTNGFYLPFSNSSNIGYDYQTSDRSGTTNDYTVSGLASTDVVPDSCTNNFCTLNFLDKSAGTFSESNLRYDTSTWDMATGTFLLPSGKWYYEVRVDESVSAKAFSVGIIEANKRRRSGNSYYWSASGWSTSDQGYLYGVNVNGTTEYKISAGSAVSLTSHPDIVQNSVIGIFIDLESATTSIKYNVDGGTPFELFTGMQDTNYTIGVSDYQVQLTFNFGQDSTFVGQETAGGNTDANGKGDFHSALPSSHTDYLALCSANLSDTTLSPNKTEQATDYFNTVLYSGANNAVQSITGVGFQGDWLWAKAHNTTSSHYLYDVNRGANKGLSSNTTSVEDTATSQFTSFDVDGFTLPADNAGYINYTGRNYVGWVWKAGGTPVSNSNGSITSSVSASAKAGFSIVTYTGDNGSSATIGHGLSSAPEVIIVFGRNVSNSHMFGATSQGWTKYAAFGNVGGYFVSDSTIWNNTAPTTTVFSVGGAANVNDAYNYVAYCFHSVEGYSAIGNTYTGNTSTDGTFVYTGFRPAWVLIKRANGGGSWCIFDNKLNPDNAVNLMLLADSNSSTSGGGTGDNLDFVSNGFKLRDNSSGRNTAGNTYIYMAFAEQPFKFSNAR